MSTLTEFDLDYKHFLDQSTLLFGESRTGKSFIIVDILHQLRPHVDQIIVISPTDRQNHTYDSGIAPLPCIHYMITPQLLNDIWERQAALSAVYSRACNSVILKQLFDRIGDRTAMDVIESIHRKLKDHKEELTAGDDIKEKIDEMSSDCKNLINMIYRHYINKNRSMLQRANLSQDEQFSLKYLNLNPRLVLIFDDCTEQIKKFKSHPVIQKIFYQGRWAYITILIACHTDKALDPELKKSAFVSIFTEETCANGYFNRKSNDLDKDAVARARAACKIAFSPVARHQKLVWVRLHKRFYKLTATPHENFKFGGKYLWEYCDRIKADAGSIVTNNKFMDEFA